MGWINSFHGKEVVFSGNPLYRGEVSEMDIEKGMILIVDDSQVSIQVLSHQLQNAGYSISVAMDGKKALDVVEKDLPDLVLLDIMMPDMDGYEICRRIRDNEGTRMIPVIFLTARSSKEDIVQGFEAGAVDYVTKPFNTAELLARVRTHVELKRARDEIKTLRGILPICAGCKAIRDEKGDWVPLEEYLIHHSAAELSHSLCPVCIRKYYPQYADSLDSNEE
jgi:DNA-binding response OmpR family regulator